MNNNLKKSSRTLYIVCSCIIVLMFICYFSSNRIKETYSASVCPTGYSPNGTNCSRTVTGTYTQSMLGKAAPCTYGGSGTYTKCDYKSIIDDDGEKKYQYVCTATCTTSYIEIEEPSSCNVSFISTLGTKTVDCQKSGTRYYVITPNNGGTKENATFYGWTSGDNCGGTVSGTGQQFTVPLGKSTSAYACYKCNDTGKSVGVNGECPSHSCTPSGTCGALTLTIDKNVSTYSCETDTHEYGYSCKANDSGCYSCTRTSSILKNPTSCPTGTYLERTSCGEGCRKNAFGCWYSCPNGTYYTKDECEAKYGVSNCNQGGLNSCWGQKNAGTSTTGCSNGQTKYTYNVYFGSTLKTCTTNCGETSCNVQGPSDDGYCTNGMKLVGWSSSISSNAIAYGPNATVTVRANNSFYPVCRSPLDTDKQCIYSPIANSDGKDANIHSEHTCEYVNIAIAPISSPNTAQPTLRTKENVQACCQSYGWTFVADNFIQAGNDHYYCISCGSSNSGGSSGSSGGGSSTKPSNSSNPSTPSNPSNPSTPNITENPQTSTILITIVWIVALGTLAYSFIYFRKSNKNNK